MKKFAVFIIVLGIFTGLLSSAHAQFGEVVYKIDGMDAVTVQSVVYRTVDGTSFAMDVYYPPSMDSASRLPAVILVDGAHDYQAYRAVAVTPKDFDNNVSWSRLIAASGYIAILYQTEHPDDLIELVSYIRNNAQSLKIDPDRIGTMAISSNGTAAISYIMQPDRQFIKAAVFYYCDMITPDGKYNALLDRFYENFPEDGDRGFYLTSELEPIEQLRQDVPLLIVRAGRDNDENPTIDHFVSLALERNVPLTLINYRMGVHGFDRMQNTEQSREIIKFTLDFLKSNLEAG